MKIVLLYLGKKYIIFSNLKIQYFDMQNRKFMDSWSNMNQNGI